MSRKPLIIFILLLAYGTVCSQEVVVMTYNIKYDNVHDTVNNWNDRKAVMVKLIEKYHPAFIGMQEVLHHQLEYLDEHLIHHTPIGVGRDDGKDKGEFSPIFYDDRFYKVLESNTFWLSETPEDISVGWDAAMERICTYGLFEHKSSKEKVWVFNTHFDHIGKVARKKSVELILEKINVLNTRKLPVLLMGDLNLTPDTKPIQVLQNTLDDGLLITEKAKEGPEGTFNGFDINSGMERRIDYIFTKGFKVNRYNHIDERLSNGKHISDHLPVVSHLIKE